jgi:hypothetical protein
VNKQDLSYQILKGEGCGLLTDKDLIEVAKWLESQGLVRCAHEKEGVAVQLNFAGIDAWMRAMLDELHVDWKPIQPGIYGIAASNEVPKQFVEEGRSVFKFSYRSLWIKPFVANIPCLPQDTIVSFADIFCERLNLRQLVERISHNQNAAFVLKWEKDGLYLNKSIIVTTQSTLQKGIIQILIEHQKLNRTEYISFEELANILQSQYNVEIDDIHNQIYKPIYILQTKVMKKIPRLAQRDDFIEMSKSACRLNASIWVMDWK